jgi:excisionase family DNA binding protein
MKPSDAARALNVEHVDYIYRLVRTGALRATKIGGRWDIDEASVQERKRRVAKKRSSRSHVATKREETRGRVEGMFT